MGGGRLHRHTNLSAVTGAQSPPPIRYRSPWLHICSWRGIEVCLAGSYGRRPTRLGAARGETPTEAQYILSGQRPAQRSTRLLKNCLGPTRGVVEGGRWTWVIGTGCVCFVGSGYTPVMPAAGVGVLSWPEI